MGKPPSPSKKGSGHIERCALSSSMRSENGSVLFEDQEDGDLLYPSQLESALVNRETATHLAFAKSRREEFVYVPTKHYHQLLNDHCQWDREAQSALFVVIGQPGEGKSALLANWAEERRRLIKGEQELIYEHYCGCSFDSVKLSSFLFRFMYQLKVAYNLRDFELAHEHEEEKLKFSFSRCLEAATGEEKHKFGSAFKRKGIILVLDGIDCIRTEDGGDSLSWLPNALPAGIRIIASATQGVSSSCLRCCRDISRQPAVYDSDGDLVYDVTLPLCNEESHTIRELRRRNAAFMLVEPLDEVSCLSILEAYKHKATCAWDFDVNQLAVGACGSSNPLYMRLMLNGLELFDSSEVDQRRQWLDQASKSDRVNSIYELLMKQWNVILLKSLFADLHEHTSKLDMASSVFDKDGKQLSASNSNESWRNSSIGASAEPSGGQTSVSGAILKTSQLGGQKIQENVASFQDKIEQRSLLVRHALSLLAVSRFGLSENDLLRLLGTNVSRNVCQQLLLLFKPHLLTIQRLDCGLNAQRQSVGVLNANSISSCGSLENGGKGILLYDLSHNQLRLLIRYGFLNDDHLRSCYYRELAVYFEAMEACQRRVDELPIQLERCSMWVALQNSLVNMKMFQLWWSERNRQDFFRHWMVLSLNCSMHDPVEGFIRSLDEYIVKEAPKPEQILSIVLSITEFLRAWQKFNASQIAHPVLDRPKPPQLQEFLTSLGNSSVFNPSEAEVERVQREINALVIHQEDGYYPWRWLWVQFPLIAIAFGSRIFRSSVISQTSTNSDSCSGFEDEAMSTASSEHADRSPCKKIAGAVKKTHQLAAGVLLPKGFGKSKRVLPSTKRRPPFKTLPSPGYQSLTDDGFGALEFLSVENNEETLCSVSNFKSQLMDIRMKYDKIKFVACEKQEALRAIESRLMDAKAKATASGQSATLTDELLESIRNVNDEATLGRQRSKYYNFILRQCELHPARDPKTIESAEEKIKKLKRDIVELQQKTHVVSYEKRRAKLDVPKLVQVTQNKTSIHQEALSRLRWRLELDKRLYYAGLLASNNGPHITKPSSALDVPHVKNTASATKDERLQLFLDPTFLQAKNKLIHRKETSRVRQETVESLQLYVGSSYQDDGILGALRQVGINKLEEALLCWQNQREHSVQLEEEANQVEQRVVESRERLKLLQAQLVNLKLSGSSSGQDNDSFENDVTKTNPEDDAADLKKCNDLKMLEKQLGEAIAVKQNKKERVARMRSLQDKLQLGLLHIAQLLGLTSVQHLNAVELVDSIEKIVRAISGDEAPLQAASSPSFRRKNSPRMANTTGQSKDSAKFASDARSDGDKLRFNIRVSHTSKRRMNPYVDNEFNDDDGEEDEDDDDEDVGDNTHHSDNNDRYGSPCRADQLVLDANTVKKRQDIKNRSKFELERIQTAQKKKVKD